jgi:hypothetical protein
MSQTDFDVVQLHEQFDEVVVVEDAELSHGYNILQLLVLAAEDFAIAITI